MKETAVATELRCTTPHDNLCRGIVPDGVSASTRCVLDRGHADGCVGRFSDGRTITLATSPRLAGAAAA